MSGDSVCNRCGAPIVWLKTKSGKNIPVDPEDVRSGDVYDKGRHSCHFDTCGRQAPGGPVVKDRRHDYEKPEKAEEDEPDPGF